MVKSNELLNHIIDLKTDVSAIKQHLKDMNGKLVTHNEQLNTSCPLKHKEVDKKIDLINKFITKVKIRDAKIYMAFTIINAIVVFAITHLWK